MDSSFQCSKNVTQAVKPCAPALWSRSALPAPGKHIEHDEFAGQILGLDARIEDLDDFDRLLFMAHRIDQGAQQVWRRGKEPFEDVVVLGVKQDHGGTCRLGGASRCVQAGQLAGR